MKIILSIVVAVAVLNVNSLAKAEPIPVELNHKGVGFLTPPMNQENEETTMEVVVSHHHEFVDRRH